MFFYLKVHGINNIIDLIKLKKTRVRPHICVPEPICVLSIEIHVKHTNRFRLTTGGLRYMVIELERIKRSQITIFQTSNLITFLKIVNTNLWLCFLQKYSKYLCSGGENTLENPGFLHGSQSVEVTPVANPVPVIRAMLHSLLASNEKMSLWPTIRVH